MSESQAVPAFDFTMDLLRRKEKFDLDRPHTYKWIFNEHLPISDPNYIQIVIVWLDEEEDDNVQDR